MEILLKHHHVLFLFLKKKHIFPLGWHPPKQTKVLVKFETNQTSGVLNTRSVSGDYNGREIAGGPALRFFWGTNIWIAYARMQIRIKYKQCAVQGAMLFAVYGSV